MLEAIWASLGYLASSWGQSLAIWGHLEEIQGSLGRGRGIRLPGGEEGVALEELLLRNTDAQTGGGINEGCAGTDAETRTEWAPAPRSL